MMTDAVSVSPFCHCAGWLLELQTVALITVSSWGPNVVPTAASSILVCVMNCCCLCFSDLHSDLALLLDCLKFQQGSRDARRQALQTVASICSDNGWSLERKLCVSASGRANTGRKLWLNN